MLGSGTQPQHLISSPSRTQPHKPKGEKNPRLPPNPSSPRGMQVKRGSRQLGGQKSGTESSNQRHDSVGRSRSGRFRAGSMSRIEESGANRAI